ncbi:ATP-dependent RNA helicase dhx8 [Phtheirospermum japonicum]|uniref:RNA helicase n=1 Tax=Phtheirospermum japonicum TaxID=374723 RepID=A0A830BQN7_9LAMI|nr:ATP-dependent RNA helicase dhx8 [Phtheirospermum japonicum]
MAQLPILQFEEKIAETVEKNSIVVIIGETGSGKSTQLSQILHRRGYTKSGCIAVTQPRRVAAVSVSRYLTDGVLLRESLSNPELNQYSVIILDEAHERSLNTDILLGLMKRLIKLRASNLKILITSATLDGEKVSRFFSNCPILNVPGKLFPVEIQHSSERPKSYLEASLKTAIVWISNLMAHENFVDIHVREPEGDVLIFMTGQDDIEKLVSKLEERIQNLEEGSCIDAVIFPLHGSLPPELQVRVFSPPLPNCRRFIVSTNIAETSLTVDGVVYVVDSGFVKQRQYNPSTGMYSLDVIQISNSVPISTTQIHLAIYYREFYWIDFVTCEESAPFSLIFRAYYALDPIFSFGPMTLGQAGPVLLKDANQRAGRAGRTRPGKCYRLYPSVIYNDDFLDATVPEIQRSSLAGTVLYLKSLDLPDIDILKFDFLDPPSSEALEDAIKQLYLIDAIDEDGSITSLGRTMAGLPLEPSLSRTLLEANECGCLSQALTVAAMLSAETNLLLSQSKSTEKKRKHTPPSNLPDGSGWGDHIQLLQIFELWHQTSYNVDWCKENNLQVRGMMFVKDVRKQLCQIIQKIAKGSMDVKTSRRHKDGQDYRALRKALCSGYANQLAERMIRHNGFRTLGFKSQLVQVHPSSVLKADEDGMLPNYAIYHELIATTRPYMRNVCAVEMHWVRPILAKLDTLNIVKLSGGTNPSNEKVETDNLKLPKVDAADAATQPLDDRESRVLAARERFLARKGNR